MDRSGASCLYKFEDTFCQLEVLERDNIRWLVFGKDEVQSCIDMQEKHKRLLPHLVPMTMAPMFSRQAKSALVLGLGGGAIIHHLRHFYPQLSITAVEKEEKIAVVAKKYFAIEENSSFFSIKIMDALDFVKMSKRKFDLIFVDIFGPNDSANRHLPVSFYQNCAVCLSSKGSIAFNSICYKKDDAAYTMSVIHETFHKKTIAFPIKQHLNLVIIGTHNKSFERKVNSMRQNNELITQYNSSTYGMIADFVPGVP